jgi:hypothetical protein
MPPVFISNLGALHFRQVRDERTLDALWMILYAHRIAMPMFEDDF